jgi:Peptidyl-prolyl cis-trans isomerase (rotamase) - cyclophilin family
VSRFFFLFLVSGLVCLNVLGQEKTTTPKISEPTATPKKSNSRPADSTAQTQEPFDGATIEKMSGQCVRLDTESGVIELEMLAESAPETVRNFLNLVATKAYDTTSFSRVVKDFVIQGGNLGTSQTLTPALAQRSRRTISDEPNSIKHERGIVSMARPETPNGATTNFFILVGDAPHLDGKFAAFARVTRGMDIVDAINKAPVEGEKPEKPVRITRATLMPCAK